MKTVRTPYLTISYSHMLNERWKNKSGKTDCVIHLDPAPPPPLTICIFLIAWNIPYFILFDNFFNNFPLFLSYSLPFLHSFTSALSLSPTLLLSSSLPPTCFYITLFSMRSTVPYMPQLIGPAAQLKFTIATMIQSPSNGFYFHPTLYSGTPISPQPIVQWVKLIIDNVWLTRHQRFHTVSQSSSQQWVAEIHERSAPNLTETKNSVFCVIYLWFWYCNIVDTFL